MPIPFSTYVDITSSQVGASALAPTDLVTRIFTTSPLVPTGGAVVSFMSAAQVGSYFGVESEEYARAGFYFGWTSKAQTSPKLLQFSGWNGDTATAPLIFGANLASSSVNTTLATLNAVTSGGFALTLGGVTNQVTGLNFSAAGSLAAVATIIETAIQTFTGTMWTSATVTYDVTSGGFDLAGGVAGIANVIVASPASGEDISSIIGWSPSLSSMYPNGPVFSFGGVAETVTTALQNSYNQSNNFASFVFTDAAALTPTEVLAAATWNNGLNVTFMYLVQVTAANFQAISDSLLNIQGTAMTLAPLSNQYPEMVPGMILAATNYFTPNSVQNYMFNQFPLTPSVSDAADYQSYTTARVNFYGFTQEAGRNLSFYQTGVLSGTGVNTNITDMTAYANEIWLRNYAGVEIMNLLIAQTQVSANSEGVAQIQSAVQQAVNVGLSNGTISVQGFLTNTQVQAITTLAGGDINAWYQVQNAGYWLTCTIDPITVIATYTLIYKKDDVIRQVVGRHALV